MTEEQGLRICLRVSSGEIMQCSGRVEDGCDIHERAALDKSSFRNLSRYVTTGNPKRSRLPDQLCGQTHK